MSNMSNNVVSIASRSAAGKGSIEEPTELQRAVLARARELRERENQPRTRTPVQWTLAAVMAIACFGVMYGAVDAVLRKMQHVTQDFMAKPAGVAPAPAGPSDGPGQQSRSPDQPYFVDLQPTAKPKL